MTNNLNSDVFQHLGPFTKQLAENALWHAAELKLPQLAQWALRTVRAMPPSEASAPGYRDLGANEQGDLVWKFPRSNSAERIEAFMWMAEKLKDSQYLEQAVRYADAMIDDPIRGIYQGPEEDGIGQVWYWTDFGLYMTNYTMRVPPALLELAKVTGNEKYREFAEICGKQLLRSQRETGILREGWCPKNPPPQAPVNQEKLKSHLHPDKINSRIGYVSLAFASLYKDTENAEYLIGLERFLESFEKYQNPDGSFPHEIRNDRIEVFDPMVKGHFHGYILNGMAKAASILPQNLTAARIAERLGQFVLREYRQSWCCPYINLHDAPYGIEGEIWHTSTPDMVYGLTWLTELTGEPCYRELACRIALQAMFSCFDCPEMPDIHGGFPAWLNRRDNGKKGNLPYLGGWWHFWLLLGLGALDRLSAPC